MPLDVVNGGARILRDGAYGETVIRVFDKGKRVAFPAIGLGRQWRNYGRQSPSAC